MTESQFEWDGIRFHIQGISWSARTENLRRSPHVALVIRNGPENAALVVHGEATLNVVGGDAEQIMITVRPARFQWLPQPGRSAG